MRLQAKHITILLILVASPMLAQSPTELTPLEKKQLTILSEPATLYKGFLRAGYFMGFQFNDQRFDDKGERIFIRNDNQYGTAVYYEFDLTYGITDRIQVAVLFPIINLNLFGTQIQQVPLQNEEETIFVKARSSGLRDIQLYGYYQIIEESTTFPAIIGRLLFQLPTSDPDQTLKIPESGAGNVTIDWGPGSGQLTTSARITARKVMYPFLYAFDFEYLYNFEGSLKFNGQTVDLASGSSQDYYATFGMHLNDWITLSGELNFRNIPALGEKTEVNVDRRTWAISPLLSFQIQRFRLFQVLRIPLAGVESPATTSYAMKVLYTF